MPELRLDCCCTHLTHRLAVWFDDDLNDGLPAAYEDFSVSMGTPEQAHLLARVQEAWNVLSGKRAIYAEVILNREDAIALRSFLDEYIDA